MDNISSAHIQSQVGRMQQEGAKTAATLYGAATSGKADEETTKADEGSHLKEEQDAPVDTAQGSMQAAGEGGEVREQYESSTGEETPLHSSEDTAEKSAGLSAEAMETARELVESKIENNEATKEMTSPKEVKEPESLELSLVENIAVMDIHDLMSGKPLPPILDDPYDIHRENS